MRLQAPQMRKEDPTMRLQAPSTRSIRRWRPSNFRIDVYLEKDFKAPIFRMFFSLEKDFVHHLLSRNSLTGERSPACRAKVHHCIAYQER